MKLYLYAWRMAFWAAYKARTKKHGAGPMRWLHVWRLMDCVRILVWGQHQRPPKFPKWLPAPPSEDKPK
jgi:hypothetical protein